MLARVRVVAAAGTRALTADARPGRAVFRGWRGVSGQCSSLEWTADSTRFQPGFHLSCMVFGWLDDTNGHVRRDLGVAKHHFYDLEKRYPIGTTTEVGPGVVVEAFRHGVT